MTFSHGGKLCIIVGNHQKLMKLFKKDALFCYLDQGNVEKQHLQNHMRKIKNGLEMLYLIERIPAWTKTMYDRVGKKDKLFMTDTGMLGHLLNWTSEKIMFDGSFNGLLLETFVCNQLLAIIEAQDETYELFHYRDKDKREIDFIIENEGGELLGIEVKAGSSVSKDSFKHLSWFKENMSKNKPFKGVVLYTGEHSVPFGENFWAIPINSLWS